jgi:hypothetical protein
MGHDKEGIVSGLKMVENDVEYSCLGGTFVKLIPLFS